MSKPGPVGATVWAVYAAARRTVGDKCQKCKKKGGVKKKGGKLDFHHHSKMGKAHRSPSAIAKMGVDHKKSKVLQILKGTL